MSNPFEDPAVQQAVVNAAVKNPKKAFAVAKKVHQVNKAMTATESADAAFVDDRAGVSDDPAAQDNGGRQKIKKTPWALYCGTWCGIPVHIHSMLPLFLIIHMATSFIYKKPFLWMVLNLSLDVVTFISILIHELGHCFATKMVGGFITHILLWPLGGLAYVGHGGGSTQEVWIALAGPLTHIPQILGWGAAAIATNNMDHFFMYAPWGDNGDAIADNFGQFFIRGCLYQQIYLLALNLVVPCYPLDGGRIFAASLIKCFSREKTATIIMVTSIPIAAGIIIMGIYNAQVMLTFIGAWCLFQTLLIWRAKATGGLGKHPLFLFDAQSRDERMLGGGSKTQVSI